MTPRPSASIAPTPAGRLVRVARDRGLSLTLTVNVDDLVRQIVGDRVAALEAELADLKRRVAAAAKDQP